MADSLEEKEDEGFQGETYNITAHGTMVRMHLLTVSMATLSLQWTSSRAAECQ